MSWQSWQEGIRRNLHHFGDMRRLMLYVLILASGTLAGAAFSTLTERRPEASSMLDNSRAPVQDPRALEIPEHENLAHLVAVRDCANLARVVAERNTSEEGLRYRAIEKRANDVCMKDPAAFKRMLR